MHGNRQLFNEVTRYYIATCGRVEAHYSAIARQLYDSIEADVGRVIGVEAMQCLDFARHKTQFHCLMLADQTVCVSHVERYKGIQLRELVDEMHEEREMALLRAIAHLSVDMVSTDVLRGAVLVSRHRLLRHARLRKRCRLQIDALQFLYHDIVCKYERGSSEFESASRSVITRLEGMCIPG